MIEQPSVKINRSVTVLAMRTGQHAPRRSLATERASALNPPPSGGLVRQVVIAVIVVISVIVALISLGAIGGAAYGYFGVDFVGGARLGERVVLLVFATLLSVGAIGCFIAGEVFMCVPALKNGVTKLETRVEVVVAVAFVMASLALSCWIMGISFFPLRDTYGLDQKYEYLVPGILLVVSSFVVAIVMVLYVELRIRLCTGWGKVSRSYLPYALHGILFLIYSLLWITFIPVTVLFPYDAHISLVNLALPAYVIGCILLCSQSPILMTVAGCIGTTLCFAFGLIPGTAFPLYRQREWVSESEMAGPMFQASPFVVVVSLIGLVLSFGPGFRGFLDICLCGRNVDPVEEEEIDEENEAEQETRSLWRGNSWSEGRLFLANVLSGFVTVLAVLYSAIQLIGFLGFVSGGYFGLSFVYPDPELYEATRGSVGFFLCLGIGIFHFGPWVCGQNVLYPFALLIIGGLLTPSVETPLQGIPTSVIFPVVILMIVVGFVFYGYPRVGVEEEEEEEEGVKARAKKVHDKQGDEEEEGEWEEEWEEEDEEDEEELVVEGGGDEDVPKKPPLRPELKIFAWLSRMSRSVKTGCTGSLFSPCEMDPSPSADSADGARTSFCTESVYTFVIFICTCALVLLRSYFSPSQTRGPWSFSFGLIYGKGVEIASWIALFLLGVSLVLRLMKLLLPINLPNLCCKRGGGGGREDNVGVSKPARFYLTLGPLFTVAFCFVLTLTLASIRYLTAFGESNAGLDRDLANTNGIKIGSLLLLILMFVVLVSSNLYFLVAYGYLRLRKNEEVSRLKLQTMQFSLGCLSFRLSSFWGLEFLQMLCQIVVFIVAMSMSLYWSVPLFTLISYLLTFKPRFVLSLDLKTRVGTVIPKGIRPTFLLPFIFALSADWMNTDEGLPGFGLAFMIAAIEVATSRGNWYALVNVGVSVTGVVIWRVAHTIFWKYRDAGPGAIRWDVDRMRIICAFLILGLLLIRNVFSAVSTYWRKKKESSLCCPGKPRLKVKVTSLSEFDSAFGEDVLTGGLQFLALFLGLAATENVRDMFPGQEVYVTVAWQVGITMLAFLGGYKRGLSLRFSETHFDSELLRVPTLVPLAAAIFVTIVRYINADDGDCMGLVSVFLLIPISKLVLHRRRRIVDSCLFVLMCLLMIGLVVMTSRLDIGTIDASTIISCVMGGVLFVVLVVDVGIDLVTWIAAKIRGAQKTDAGEEREGEGEEVAISWSCGNVYTALDSFASQIFRASLFAVVSVLCLPIISRLDNGFDRTFYFYVWGIIVLIGYLLAFEFEFVFLKGLGCCMPSGVVLPKCFRPANFVMLCVMFFIQLFPIVDSDISDNQAWILVLLIFAIDFEVSPGRYGIINGIIGILAVSCSILLDFFRGYGDGNWVWKGKRSEELLQGSIWGVRSLSFAVFAVLILENNIRKIWVPYIRSGELKTALSKMFSSKGGAAPSESAPEDAEAEIEEDGKIVDPDAVVMLEKEPADDILAFGDLEAALADFWKLEFCGAGFEQLFCLVCMMFVGWHFMTYAWMGEYDSTGTEWGKHAWDGYAGALIAIFMWLSTFKPEYVLFRWRKDEDDVRKFLLPRMLRPTLLMVLAVCAVGLAFKSQFWILAFLVIAVEFVIGQRKFLIANLVVGAVVLAVFLIVDGAYLIALFRKPVCGEVAGGSEMCVEGILPLRWVLIIVLLIGLLIHNIVMHVRHWKALLKQREIITIPCKCPKCSDWTFLLWEIKEGALIVVILCLAYPLLLEFGAPTGNWPFSIVYVAVLVAIWIFSFKPLGFAFSTGKDDETEEEGVTTFVLPRLLRPTFLLSGAGYLLLVISSPDAKEQVFPRMVLWGVFGFALLIEAAVGLFTSRSSRVVLGICLLVAGIPFVLGDILNLTFRKDQYDAWGFAEIDSTLLLILRLLVGAAAIFLLVIDNIVAHVTFVREKASSWLTVVGWFRMCCPARKPDVVDDDDGAEEEENPNKVMEDVGFLRGVVLCGAGGVKTVWPLTVEFFHGILHLAATYLMYPLLQHNEMYGPAVFASLMVILWLSSFKLEFVIALSEEGARYCFPKLLRPTVLIPLVGIFILIVCNRTPYYMFGLIPILVELITARRANGVANVLIAAFYFLVICGVGEFRGGSFNGDFENWEGKVSSHEDWTFFFMRMASAGVLMFVLAVTAIVNLIRWIQYIREQKNAVKEEEEETEWIPWRSIRSVDFGNLGNDLFIALLQAVVIYLTYPTLGYAESGIFLGVLLVLSVLGFHPGFMPILELSPTRKIAFAFVGLLRPSLIVPLIGFAVLMFYRSYLWPFALIFPLLEMEMSLIFRMRVLNLPVFFVLVLLFMVYGPEWVPERSLYKRIPRIVFIFGVLVVLAFDNVLHHVFFWILPAIRERARKNQVTAPEEKVEGAEAEAKPQEETVKSWYSGLQIAHFTPLATEIYHAMLLVVVVLFLRTNFSNWDYYLGHWLSSSSAFVCLCFAGWFLSLKREFLILDKPNGPTRITFTLPRMLRPSLHVIPIAMIAYKAQDPAFITFYARWCVVLMFYALDSLLGKIKHRWANVMIFGLVAVAGVVATTCYGGNESDDASPILRVVTVCILLFIILVDNLFHWIRSVVLRRKMELQVVPVPITKECSTAFRSSNCSERLFGFFYDLHHAFLLIAAFGVSLGSFIWNGLIEDSDDSHYYILMVVVASVGWLVSFKPFHAVSMSKKVCDEPGLGVIGRLHAIPKLLRPSLIVTILVFNAIGILFGSFLSEGEEWTLSYILVLILIVEIWIEMNVFSMVSLLFAFLGLTPSLLYWWIKDESYNFSHVAARYHLNSGWVPWWRPVTRDIILLAFLLVGFLRSVFRFFPKKKEEAIESKEDLGEKVPEMKEREATPATGMSRFVEIRNPVATYASSMIFFVVMMMALLLSGSFHIASLFCFLPMPIMIVFLFPANPVYKKICLLVAFVVYMVKILPSLGGMVPESQTDLDYQLVDIILMAIGAVYWAVFVLIPPVRTRLDLPWMSHLFFDISQMKANGECNCQDVTNVILNIIYYLVRAGAVAGISFGPTVLYFSPDPDFLDPGEETIRLIWLFYICSLFSFFYLVACVVFLAGDFLTSILLPVYVFYQFWFPSYFYSGDLSDDRLLELDIAKLDIYFIPFLVSGIFSLAMFLVGKLTDIFGVSSLFPLEVRQDESKSIHQSIEDFKWEFHYFWAIGMTLGLCYETPWALNIPAYAMFVIILIRTLVSGSFFQVVVATTFSLLQIMYMGKTGELRHSNDTPYGDFGFIPVLVQVVVVCILSGLAFDIRRARTKAEAPKTTKIAWKRLAVVGGRGVVTLSVFLFPLLLYASFGDADSITYGNSLGVIVIYEVLGVVYVFYLGIILGNYLFLLLTPFLTFVLTIVVLTGFPKILLDLGPQVVVWAGLAGWVHALILYIFSQTGVMYAFNSPVAKSLLVYPFHALWRTIKRLLSCCKGGKCLTNLRWFGPGKLYAKITEKKLAAARAAGVEVELEEGLDKPSLGGVKDISLGKEKGSQTDVVVQITETETKLVDLAEESSEEEYEEESEWEGESGESEGSEEPVTIEVVYVNGSGSGESGEIEEEIVYVSASEEEGEVVYVDESTSADSEEKEVEEEEVLTDSDDSDDDDDDGNESDVRSDFEDPFDFLFTDEESGDDEGEDDDSDKVVLSCGRYFQLLCAELGKNMKGSFYLPMSKNLTVFLLFILVALSGMTPTFGVLSLVSCIALAAHAWAYRLYVPLIFSPLVAGLFCGLSTGLTFLVVGIDPFSLDAWDGKFEGDFYLALCFGGVGLSVVSVVVLSLTGIRDCCICLGRIDDSEPKAKDVDDEEETPPEYRDELMAIMQAFEVLSPSCPKSSACYGRCMGFDLLKLVTFTSRSGTPKYAWWRFGLHTSVSTFLMIGVYLATLFPLRFSTGLVCAVGWTIGVVELVLFCILKTDESQQIRLIVCLIRILATTLLGGAMVPLPGMYYIPLAIFLVGGAIFGFLVAGILIYLMIAFLRRHEERSRLRAIELQEEELLAARTAKFENCRRSIESRDFNAAKGILGRLKEELKDELEEGSELADDLEDLQSYFNIGMARHTLTIACGFLGDLRFVEAVEGYRVAKECPHAPDDLKADCEEFEENFRVAMQKEVEASREFVAGGGFADARKHLERVTQALRNADVKKLKVRKIRKMARTAGEELTEAETANAAEILDAAKAFFREKKFLNCMETLKRLKETGKFQSEMKGCVMAVAKVAKAYAARADAFLEAQEYEKARELYAQIEHLGVGAYVADRIAQCDKLRRSAVSKLKTIDRRMASKKLRVTCGALRLIHELMDEYPPFRIEASKRLLKLKQMSSGLLQMANELYSEEKYSEALEILESVVKMDPDSQKFAEPLVELCVTERRAAKGIRSARKSLTGGLLKEAIASAKKAMECSLKDNIKGSGKEILEEVSRVSALMLSKAQEVQLLLHRTRSALKISASVDAHPTVPTLPDDGPGVDVITASVDAHATVPSLPEDDGSGVHVITASVDAHPTVPSLPADGSGVAVITATVDAHPTVPTLPGDASDSAAATAPTLPEDDASAPSAPTFPQDASARGEDAVRTVLFAKPRPEGEAVPSAPTFPNDVSPPSAFLQETWGKGCGDFFAALAERPEMVEQMPVWLRELIPSQEGEGEERGEEGE